MDMMNMLGKIKEVQARLKESKENLVNIQVTAESGAGMVKVTVNGNRQVIKLGIDPDLFQKEEDKEMMQDLIIAAVNKAMIDIEEKIREELKKSTEGILPNIPGMDFSNLV